MAWDFRTDDEYQAQLDWVDAFVREEIEPLDLVLGDPFDKSDVAAMALVRPLQQQVKDRGLWATHLGPALGGQGYGQLKLALLNELLGHSRWAPSVFGTQAPDSGNGEILAHYGTDEQKARYLGPLLDGAITSCYSMTEPQAGSDPSRFTTSARRDGDDWVISGEKWFAAYARWASFFIVMVVTDPDVGVHAGTSMFIVPRETPGLEVVRNVGLGGQGEGEGVYGYLRFNDVRVPADHLLGGEGQAFSIAQTRLGGNRLHHAMRTIAQVRRALDMLCERALSRHVGGGALASLGTVQELVANSWIEIEQFRLLVLRTAWLLDQDHDYKAQRKHIAAVKALAPKVFHDVVQRAMHLHGALGVSNEMPFVDMLLNAEMVSLADGPTEVHKVTVAKQVLAEHHATDGVFPSAHIPTRRAAARDRFAAALERAVGNE